MRFHRLVFGFLSLASGQQLEDDGVINEDESGARILTGGNFQQVPLLAPDLLPPDSYRFRLQSLDISDTDQPNAYAVKFCKGGNDLCTDLEPKWNHLAAHFAKVSRSRNVC